jgi:hypothetical protein
MWASSKCGSPYFHPRVYIPIGISIPADGLHIVGFEDEDDRVSYTDRYVYYGP